MVERTGTFVRNLGPLRRSLTYFQLHVLNSRVLMTEVSSHVVCGHGSFWGGGGGWGV